MGPAALAPPHGFPTLRARLRHADTALIRGVDCFHEPAPATALTGLVSRRLRCEAGRIRHQTILAARAAPPATHIPHKPPSPPGE